MGERWVVDSMPSRRYPIYTRANVGEVFPDPVAPLSATIGIQQNAEPGWRDALARFGAFDPSEFDPSQPEIIGVYGGYCYLNVSISRIFGVRTPGLSPEAVDDQLFGEQPGIPPYEPADTDDSPTRSEHVQQTLGWILTTDGLPELLDDRAMLDQLVAARPALDQLTDAALVERLRTLMGTHFRHLFGQHLFVTYCSMVPIGILQQVCEQVGRPADTLKLMAGVGDVDSAAPSFAMWELSRLAPQSDEFQAGFAAFLDKYGCRGPNEWEMRSPTWETDPELALVAIEQMRAAPDEEAPPVRHAARVAERERLGAEIAAVVEAGGDAEVHGQFLAALRAATVFLAGRERTKTNAIRLIHQCRLAMHELGRRMVERGHADDAFCFGMIRDDELDEWLADPGAMTAEVRRREAAHAALAGLEPPFVFKGDQPAPEEWNARNARPVVVARPGDSLQGIPGCCGRACGRARVVLDPRDPTALEPGDVLVAPITDPSWTPLFVPASAVVVDVGAPLSHAIIVSRELGIPCVVSLTDGTRRIPDGAMVEVDGDSGIVTVLEA